MTRAERPSRVLVIVAMATALVALPAAGDGHAESNPAGRTPPLPEVEGPITGPGEMFIDGFEQTSPVSAADNGYTFEEYFVSGTAANEPYTVRLLVAAPADASAELFSGHVLVEPKHGTGIPFVWNFTREYLMARGHGAVEVSVFPSTVERTLKGANPERYADLRVADEQASDILAQVGVLLKSDETPLSGARWLHMTGHSMAVGPVWHYMDTHHDRRRLADGDPIYDGFFPETTRTASRLGKFPDVDVPTVLINSELEVEVVLVEEGIDYRKPDSDEPGEQFRLYEVAGMPHNPSWQYPALAGLGLEDSCDQPLNSFGYAPMVSMALDHLLRWAEDGTPPPRAKRIAVEGDRDDPTAIRRDEHGNAVGGVRSTFVDVPVAAHAALNSGEGVPGVGDCLVFGAQRDFTEAELQNLYGSHAGYVNRFNRRLNELIDDGWYLPEFAPALRLSAAQFAGLP